MYSPSEIGIEQAEDHDDVAEDDACDVFGDGGGNI